MNNYKKNSFFLFSTPIGNLKEVNQRFIENVQMCEYLFCEDTRTTKKFLNLIGLHLPNLKLISYHKFNEKSKLTTIIELILNYKCGLISDAGYPGISDPGNDLIAYLRNNYPEIKIEVVNCANAAICAVAASGFKTESFYYCGFLSRKSNELKQDLINLKKFGTTLIIYESVHRIIDTLKLIKNVFESCKICVAKELTKINEKFYYGDVDNIIKEIDLRGEFVILIDNNKSDNNKSAKKQLIDNSAINSVNELVSLGLRLKDACKYISKQKQIDSSELYKYFQSKK